MDFSQFLVDLWAARMSLLAGFAQTLVISAVAILLGTGLGVLVGLGLT